MTWSTWLALRVGCPSNGPLAIYQKKVKGEIQIAFFKYPQVIQSLDKRIGAVFN